MPLSESPEITLRSELVFTLENASNFLAVYGPAVIVSIRPECRAGDSGLTAQHAVRRVAA